MDKKSNPAKRLYEIVKEAKAFDGNVNAISGWVEVFKLSSSYRYEKDSPFDQALREINKRNEEIEAMRCLSQLIKLIDDVEKILKAKDDEDYESYRTPLPKIRSAIIPSRFNEGFSATLTQISDADIHLLRLCAKAIGKEFSEKIIDEEDLWKIASEISELYEEIVKSKINQELKTLLLELLEAMRQAIHEYRIRGVNSLKDSISLILGKIIMNEELILNSDSEEVGKVKKLIGKFTSLYSFAADTVQLLEAGSKYLPLLLVAAEHLNK